MSLSCSSPFDSLSLGFYSTTGGVFTCIFSIMIFCISFWRAICVCIMIIWLIYWIGLFPRSSVRTYCLTLLMIWLWSTIKLYIYLAFIAISLRCGWFLSSDPVEYNALVQLVMYFLGFSWGSMIDPVMTVVYYSDSWHPNKAYTDYFILFISPMSNGL